MNDIMNQNFDFPDKQVRKVGMARRLTPLKDFQNRLSGFFLTVCFGSPFTRIAK